MIHVQAWTGAGNFRITDMSNAGKRGKRCPVVRFIGWIPSSSEEPYRTIAQFTNDLLAWAQSLPESSDFATVAAELRARVTAANLPQHAANVYDEEIRAIDAPKPVLTAGIPGKWSASADNDGITVNEDEDQNNQPCCITFDQSSAKAYQLAAKVWDEVRLAISFSVACDILRRAGCKLHYYCRMD